MIKPHSKPFSAVLGMAVLIVTTAVWASDPMSGVSVDQLPGKLVIQIDGTPFAEYVVTNSSRPYFYPIYGPGGALMTRNWPMKEVPGEAHDHPHHKGLWYAHGAVNGIDFWSEAPGAGKVVHRKFMTILPGKRAGMIESDNDWVSDKGEVVCSDKRTLRFGKRSKNSTARFIDFEIEIIASQGPITFGDTKEGTMAIRIAESMRVSGGEGKGHILNSEGVRDKETWGKKAKWCDYTGPVNGKTVGIAMFDHPKNPRHPTWWHVRDYGLFAANPFGQHDFEKLSDPAAGKLTLEKGQSIRFKYRFLFHEGELQEKEIQDCWKDFVK